MAGVKELGYVTPTPINFRQFRQFFKDRTSLVLPRQEQAKQPLLCFRFYSVCRKGPRGCVRALIIAPTRELAEQIHDATQGLGKQTRLRSVTVYGGVNMTPQIPEITR